jgi:glucose-1-phosphate adenylyltransferase
VKVGEGCKLRRCIIDKHVRVPAGEVIGYDLEQDKQRFTVSAGGIVVVPKSYRFGNTTSAPSPHLAKQTVS